MFIQGAMTSYRYMTIAQKKMSKSMLRLSTGLRINSAADDPAGLAISEKMRAQIRGLNMASRNAQDAISLIQVAEGGLEETHSILQRMKELATQAANGTLSKEDRDKIQSEIDQLAKEVSRISSHTEFNGKPLLNGDYKTNELKFQVGANSGQTIGLTIDSMDAASLGIAESGTGEGTKGLDVSTPEKAGEAIEKLSNAINTVSSERGKLGAMHNRLEHTINYLENTSENLQAAESRIRDADMAKEMMEYTKNSILHQVATMMMSQANQQARNVLELLKTPM